MYSIVLMAAMTSSPAQPQGIFFNRGGCSSATATASACSGRRLQWNAPVRTWLANRPRFFARGGCSGSVAVASTGCGGGTAIAQVGQLPPGYQNMPQPAEFATPEARPGLIERVAVHRYLARALRDRKVEKFSPAQKAAISACLADGDLYDATVVVVTRNLNKSLATRVAEGKPVGAVIDILKLLIDNLPQIVAAIEQIIKLFHAGIIDANTAVAMIEMLLDQADRMIYFAQCAAHYLAV